jgi:hypothetical protein
MMPYVASRGSCCKVHGLNTCMSVSRALQGPFSLAALALGAAAALTPPRLRLAVNGAISDALSEHYTEQLRALNEQGAAQQVRARTLLILALLLRAQPC